MMEINAEILLLIVSRMQNCRCHMRQNIMQRLHFAENNKVENSLLSSSLDITAIMYYATVRNINDS